MIRSILTPSLGTSADNAGFAAALAAARAFAAHIDVLHVRLDPVEVAVAMTPDTSVGTMTEGLMAQLERDAAEREARAHKAFAEFCAREKIGADAAKDAVSVEWHVEVGQEARRIAEHGLTADLIVAGRGDGSDATARTILETVLIETGRPLLIPAGPAFAMPRRAAIAWKPTAEAARAVAAALPFLERADDVAVLTVAESGGDDAQADRLVRYLARHGVRAAAERLEPREAGAPATLLAAARDRADLLVMGGYGHSRVREWVFGGFTQLALAEAPLPVLLAH